MARRLFFAAILLLAIVVPQASGDVYSRKEAVDAKLSALRDRIAAAEERESALEGEIAALASQIQSLDHEVHDLSTRLDVLEHDLELHRRRLARLTELFELQTRRLTFLRQQYDAALTRLNRRLVSIYESDTVGTLEVVLSASSFTELLDQLDYVKQIGIQDETIATAVHRAKVEMRLAREKTRKTKRIVAAATRAIAVRVQEVRALRATLLARQSALRAAQGQKQAAVSSVRESHQEFVEEADALEDTSAALAAQIRSLQAAAAAAAAAAARSSPPPPRSPSSPSSPSPSSASSSSSTPTRSVSSSGFIWPVGGAVVSGFGYRCLGGICRMHEGIDIGAGSGTPIQAAAAGTVIYAGWMSGYGNLIVIDHGGGLSTAYAHQSGFAVGSGARVSQGQVIGYVGCTGRCFGPHLHFEVRVNGGAVDPLAYL